MKSRRAFIASGLGVATAASLEAAANTVLIDKTLRSGILNRKIPNVSAMAATGAQTLYQAAFGVRDDSGVPVTAGSIFQIASMTKAITTVAALQLVEAGKVSLESDVSQYLPKLANPKVLTGFDTSGAPKTRPASRPITLHDLLTHTSGLCYDGWDENMFRLASNNKGPEVATTLMFEPGARWQYGTGLDWTGRLVEKISGISLEDYFQTHIFKPLDMQDTSFIVSAAKFDRFVSTWQRQDNGTLVQQPRKLPPPPKEFNGGGGLNSTTADYVRFMQMILRKGKGPNGTRILREDTVEKMEVNQIGALTAGKMKSFRPRYSSDVDIQPGHNEKWGLGLLINTDPYEGGRSAGSLAWAGIFNTFYWIDPKQSLCGVIMMQFLPFVDSEAVGLLGDFERAVYRSLSVARS